MVSLVVAQRTALLNILHNTSEASRNIKSVHFPELQATSRVAKIRQDIAIFTANINLLDITEQEQGDETYTKIRENLGVNTLSHNVKEQVEELSDAAQAIRSSVYNAAALIVAVDALIIEIDIDKLWPNETIKVSIILVILIVYLISRYITTKKKY